MKGQSAKDYGSFREIDRVLRGGTNKVMLTYDRYSRPFVFTGKFLTLAGENDLEAIGEGVISALYYLSERLSGGRERDNSSLPVRGLGFKMDRLFRAVPSLSLVAKGGTRNNQKDIYVATALTLGADDGRRRYIMTVEKPTFWRGLEVLAALDISPAILKDALLGQEERRLMEYARDHDL